MDPESILSETLISITNRSEHLSNESIQIAIAYLVKEMQRRSKSVRTKKDEDPTSSLKKISRLVRDQTGSTDSEDDADSGSSDDSETSETESSDNSDDSTDSGDHETQKDRKRLLDSVANLGGVYDMKQKREVITATRAPARPRIERRPSPTRPRIERRLSPTAGTITPEIPVIESLPVTKSDTN